MLHSIFLILLSHTTEHSIFVNDHCAGFCHLVTFFNYKFVYREHILWQKITSERMKLFRIMWAMLFIVQNIEARQKIVSPRSSFWAVFSKAGVYTIWPVSRSSGYRSLRAGQCSCLAWANFLNKNVPLPSYIFKLLLYFSPFSPSSCSNVLSQTAAVHAKHF